MSPGGPALHAGLLLTGELAEWDGGPRVQAGPLIMGDAGVMGDIRVDVPAEEYVLVDETGVGGDLDSAFGPAALAPCTGVNGWEAFAEPGIVGDMRLLAACINALLAKRICVRIKNNTDIRWACRVTR